MKESKPTTVEDRLLRLEKENRRLKFAGLAVIAVLGAGAAQNQIPNELSARKLSVMGPDNDVRVSLTCDDKNGAAGLVISRPKNRGPAARIGVNPAGYGELILFDNDGKPAFVRPSQ
jgi:hypothetical protein